MMRQGRALQQERQELAERVAKLERENDQRRRTERTLRQEWGDAQSSAEVAQNMIISEGRAAIHRAEEVTEARAEERHTLWRVTAELTHWEDIQRASLEAALRTAGEKPKGPCPGCINRDSITNTLEERNAVLEQKLRERNAEHHKLEADYAAQTSRLSYDLDQSRQTTATMHASKAAGDAEKAAMFKRMKFLEVEMESMTKKMMKVLSENTEVHQERSRRAMLMNEGS